MKSPSPARCLLLPIALGWASISFADSYSDHTFFDAKEGNLKIGDLNLAQTGKLMLYRNLGKDGKAVYAWSSVLRTPEILKLLKDAKSVAYFNKVNADLEKIVTDPNQTVDAKNGAIDEIAKAMVDGLNTLGFQVRSYGRIPSKTFNPAATSDQVRDMAGNPQKYVGTPFFQLENVQDFENRTAQGIDLLLKDDNVAGAQEVELGTDAYDAIFKRHMARHPKFSAVLPRDIPRNILNSCAVTFYDTNAYEDATAAQASTVESLTGILGNVLNQKDRLKLNVCALKRKVEFPPEVPMDPGWMQAQKARQFRYIVNVHEGYGEANKTDEMYALLRKVLDAVPGLVVIGDFNLEKKKQSWMTDAFKGFQGVARTQITPEPEDVGNPTWDAILISGAATQGDLQALGREAAAFNARVFTKK